jgi:hypothetical protein
VTAFISYSRANSDFAVRLAKDLRGAGFDIWLDQFDIPTGARWDDELEKALRKCTIFLIVLSPESIESQNVKDEIGFAIDSGKYILPVIIKPCQIPLRLRRFQFVNFSNQSYEDSFSEIKQLLANTATITSKEIIGTEPVSPKIAASSQNSDAEGKDISRSRPERSQAPAFKPAKSASGWLVGLLGICLVLIIGSLITVFALPKPNFLFPAALKPTDPQSHAAVATTITPMLEQMIATTTTLSKTATVSPTATRTPTQTQHPTITEIVQLAFGQSTAWQSYFCVGTEICSVGDFNGDGKDDIITFLPSYMTYVSLSGGNGFESASVWHNSLCAPPEVCLTGDFNGDRKDDVINFVHDTRSWDDHASAYVSLSNGSGFGKIELWSNYFCLGTETCAVGDFDGDGKDDIVSFTPDYKAFVSTSNGHGFNQAIKWHDYFCAPPRPCMTGDFNGDGKDDIIEFIHDTLNGKDMNSVYVALSTGNGFGESTFWSGYFCLGTETCGVGDFNGDGKDDIVAFNPSHEVDVSLSNGSGFQKVTKWHDYFCGSPEVCTTGDFNGDNKFDVIDFVHDSRKQDDHAYVHIALSTTK